MIYESIYWKRELIKLSRKLAGRQRSTRSWTAAQNGAFEKEVMIGFYIVRKLLESYKIPNILAARKLGGREYPNNGTVVHLMNNHRFLDHYDFDKGEEKKFDLPFLINQIVHSYIFSPSFELIGKTSELTLRAIHFCSDAHRNKALYEVDLPTIICLFDEIGMCDVTSTEYTFDAARKDYTVTKPMTLRLLQRKLRDI